MLLNANGSKRAIWVKVNRAVVKPLADLLAEQIGGLDEATPPQRHLPRKPAIHQVDLQ